MTLEVFSNLNDSLILWYTQCKVFFLQAHPKVLGKGKFGDAPSQNQQQGPGGHSPVHGAPALLGTSLPVPAASSCAAAPHLAHS